MHSAIETVFQLIVFPLSKFFLGSFNGAMMRLSRFTIVVALLACFLYLKEFILQHRLQYVISLVFILKAVSDITTIYLGKGLLYVPNLLACHPVGLLLQFEAKLADI